MFTLQAHKITADGGEKNITRYEHCGRPTFAIRRAGIIDEPQPIYQLLKVYPSLKRYEQFCNLAEFYAWSFTCRLLVCTCSCWLN